MSGAAEGGWGGSFASGVARVEGAAGAGFVWCDRERFQARLAENVIADVVLVT